MSDGLFWTIAIIGIVIGSILQGLIYGKILKAIKKWFTDRK